MIHRILPWVLSHATLAVDPITLLGVGLGVLGAATGGVAASQALSKSATEGAPAATPTPAPAPAASAPPVMSPQGSASTLKTGATQPSFLAAAAAPAQQNVSGTKSLLGS